MSRARFAAHLGFPTPAQPLFDALIPGDDPLDHIAFAADQGFGGIADPFAAMRPTAVQVLIGRAAARRGLRMGSFLYAPFDRISAARWASPDRDHQEAVLADVTKAIAIAMRLGSDRIAVIGLGEVGVPMAAQHRTMADTLRLAGDRAAAAGVVLAVEGVSPQRLPQMLLHGVEASAAVVRLADHPAVGLCFDTGHAAANDEDPVVLLARHRDIIATIQIADHPGRTEMGGGSIDFAALLAEADRLELASQPFELEHRWSQPGAACQRDYLARLAN